MSCNSTLKFLKDRCKCGGPIFWGAIRPFQRQSRIKLSRIKTTTFWTGFKGKRGRGTFCLYWESFDNFLAKTRDFILSEPHPNKMLTKRVLHIYLFLIQHQFPLWAWINIVLDWQGFACAQGQRTQITNGKFRSDSVSDMCLWYYNTVGFTATIVAMT